MRIPELTLRQYRDISLLRTRYRLGCPVYEHRVGYSLSLILKAFLGSLFSHTYPLRLVPPQHKTYARIPSRTLGIVLSKSVTHGPFPLSITLPPSCIP